MDWTLTMICPTVVCFWIHFQVWLTNKSVTSLIFQIRMVYKSVSLLWSDSHHQFTTSQALIGGCFNFLTFGEYWLAGWCHWDYELVARENLSLLWEVKTYSSPCLWDPFLRSIITNIDYQKVLRQLTFLSWGGHILVWKEWMKWRVTFVCQVLC